MRVVNRLTYTIKNTNIGIYFFLKMKFYVDVSRNFQGLKIVLILISVLKTVIYL